jgi:hypothetical protein
MVEIPAAVQIRTTIRQGSVYYFCVESFSSDVPHFFIVLNHFPIRDETLLLVCASSQIEKVKWRRRGLTGTVVEIRNVEYVDFTVDSIVDCNTVFVKGVDELISKLEMGNLKAKSCMDTTLVEKLRKAVLKSPLVEKSVKNIL